MHSGLGAETDGEMKCSLTTDGHGWAQMERTQMRKQGARNIIAPAPLAGAGGPTAMLTQSGKEIEIGGDLPGGIKDGAGEGADIGGALGVGGDGLAHPARERGAERGAVVARNRPTSAAGNEAHANALRLVGDGKEPVGLRLDQEIRERLAPRGVDGEIGGAVERCRIAEEAEK